MFGPLLLANHGLVYKKEKVRTFRRQSNRFRIRQRFLSANVGLIYEEKKMNEADVRSNCVASVPGTILADQAIESLQVPRTILADDCWTIHKENRGALSTLICFGVLFG